LSRKRGKAIEFPLCVSILNDNVFPLHVPKLAQSLLERVGASSVRGSGRTIEVSYLENFLRLLGLGWIAKRHEDSD
jgi:hypothetical protein